MASETSYIQNIFLMLILVTAGYLCGLMNAFKLSREIDNAPRAWWEQPRVHMANKRDVIFSPPRETLHGGQQDKRDEAIPVPPQAPVAQPPEENRSPAGDDKPREDDSPDSKERKDEGKEDGRNAEKINSKEEDSSKNVEDDTKDLLEVLKNRPSVKKQKKTAAGNNKDLRQLDFNEEYRAKYFKNAAKIRTVMNRIMHVTQDVVFFSGFDDDVDDCFMDGQFKQGCHSTSPLKHYATCAVVGGSGILTGSACGPEIDMHDFVIRFNLPHIWSYKEDVGMKVNMTVLDNYALKTIDEEMVLEPELLLEHFPQFNNSLLFYSKTIYEPKKGKHGLGSYQRYKRVDKFLKEANFNITLTYAMLDFKNVTEKMLNLVFPGFESPTIGLLSYLMALTFCDDVDIYGFYPFLTDQNGNPVPFHYHGAPVPKELSAGKAPHLFDSEYNLMSYMNSKDVIRVTVGKCQGLKKKTKLPPAPQQ
ncbi:alpha-N-acetylneuraminate alpha-2,8-sialyltransferase ST8SIA3-like isoform X1 [Branchiostoma lanceolatum]|uniref:alpha-N-acetylneuraminate alpha-2,8-sialyltransferase ST8SIA3-like isoform X1 n=1 Tax=Branchiostoma lanceolatum TaxID=7740 RepID=UPI0034538CB6